MATKPKFEKRHYDWLIEQLNTFYWSLPDTNSITELTKQQETVYRIVRFLGERFQEDNDRFDYDKWLRAWFEGDKP